MYMYIWVKVCVEATNFVIILQVVVWRRGKWHQKSVIYIYIYVYEAYGLIKFMYVCAYVWRYICVYESMSM